MGTTTTTSVPPCTENEATGGCASSDAVEQILETEVFGLRVWQFAGIILSVLLTVIIALCCCVRFRIPRTKQEIEADYIRKRITRSFGKELTKIKNEEMDEMDLRRGKFVRSIVFFRSRRILMLCRFDVAALERIRSQFDAETELQKQQEDSTLRCGENTPGFRARINAILHGVHLKIAMKEPRELDTGVI